MSRQRGNTKQQGGIAFRARRVSTFNTTANTQTTGFIFDAVDYNYASGYDVASGLFTAPVTGVYQFQGSWDVEAVGSMARAFTVFRGSIPATYKPRAVDFTTGSAGNQSRLNWILEVPMVAGENVGFDLWTSAASNIGRNTTETWVAGHLVMEV